MAITLHTEQRVIRQKCIKHLLTEGFKFTGMTKVLEWYNDDTERFYKLLVGKDLFGDLIIERQWGSTKTEQCQQMRTTALPEKVGEVVILVDGILKTRKAHGYELTEQFANSDLEFLECA